MYSDKSNTPNSTGRTPLKFANFLTTPYFPDMKKKRITLHIIAGAILLAFLWGISALGTLRTFLPHTLQLTGWPGTERNYLILFQNNEELRATGGFITAYALLEFKHGFPKDISFNDVYGEIDDHDYISPPYPMSVLLEQNSETYSGHSFRDANYNPDFIDAKDEILKFFHLVHPGKAINGTIAVNFSVLEDIVGLYDPVRVDKNQLTEDNLFETLESAVSDIDRHNIEALESRKNVIQTFAYVVLKKMIFSFWEWRELSEVVTNSLNNKELLLSFESRSLANKVSHFGWAGSFPDDDTTKYPLDRLAVNVSNFGGMKSDRYITREVHYTVDLSNAPYEILADAEVTLRHNGSYNTPLSGQYKGYVRLFAPMGTELIATSNSATGGASTTTAAEEFITSHIGWGHIVQFEPGESVTLAIVKQPGTENDYYEVVVQTDVGQTFLSNDMEIRENVAFFQATLDRDKQLDLTVLPDETGPRIFWHEVTALNQIDIAFAEAVDAASAGDPLNYEITDLDMNDPSLTDTITIDFIEVWGGHIRIHTRGMDLQDEEHFQVFIRNIRDQSGNYITPNPRTITVVQRLEEEL